MEVSILCHKCGKPKMARWFGDNICECRNKRKGRESMENDNVPTRSAKWDIGDLNVPFWLKPLLPILMRLFEPLLERYLTKLQDKSTAWIRKNQGDVLADTWKRIFWEVIDEVDDEFGFEIDDLTPEK